MKRLGLASILALLVGIGISLGPKFAIGEGIPGHTRVTAARGELAAASITGTGTGTANTVLTTTKDSVAIAIENTCAVELVVFSASFTKRMPANSFRVLDLTTNGTAFGPETYKVYYTGSSPSSCNVEVNAIPYR